MNILVKPILTEKMTTRGENLGEYGFVVDARANKLQIKAAVESVYGVVVDSVNTMNYKGKNKSRWTKTGLVIGRTGAFKKAIVKLKGNDKIDFYGNI
ncbi:MAG: 50S ribosomal protein L23 [Rikenellaceae bacterium]